MIYKLTSKKPNNSIKKWDLRAKQRIHNRGILNGPEALKEMFKVLSHQENVNQMTPRFHLTPTRMAKIKTLADSTCWQGCGERGTLFHCWWDCKLVQLLWKSIWKFLRKLEINIPEDPTIPLLGIYPKDAPPCQRGTCSTMFIEPLFVTARSWKQPRCPTTEEWIQKMWLIYTMEYHSAIKKRWIHEVLRQMNGTRNYHPEWGNPVTKEHIWYALLKLSN